MSFRKNKTLDVSSRPNRLPAPILPSTGLDPEILQQRIDICYDRLAEDPSDLEVRISLSWYLLFQSLCARRQQEFWTQLLGRTDVLDPTLSATLQTIRNETASAGQDHCRLLRDSLKHAATVMQLSGQVRERNEAARIRELVQLLGAGQVVSETDAEAKRILMRMTRAIRAVSREETQTPGRHRSADEGFVD